MLVSGCASVRPATHDRFDFSRDTFAYANELMWEYQFDENGAWSTQWPATPPQYALHCFVIARTARQFFANARFDPAQPVADAETYRKLIARVAGSDPRQPLPDEARIVIPGYANLREFSTAQEALLKSESGGAWRSYFQRGNWRMVLPFTRPGQSKTADELVRSLNHNWPPVIHVVRFPELSINHALLVFDAKESATDIQFTTYDPNDANQPITITFDRAQQTFFYPRTRYFTGGPLNVYEVYSGWTD